MWKYFLLHSVLWISSLPCQLDDVLSTADKVFQEFYLRDKSLIHPEDLTLLLKRTFDLENGRRVSKRSLENERLIQDNNGVYMLSNIQDMSRIPVKFPNDINVFSSHNLLYITALEANGSNPANQLANDLILFHYSSIQGIKELGRVPVLGGTKIAVHLFQNTTYLVAAEHEAQENPDLYQGSIVYKVVERNRRVVLEKIQILNVIQPNDVKFWEHQDQLYLVIGTNMGMDSQRTGTLVYRWLGYHFDCLQVIPSKNVRSVMPFSIGSFMYLAVANFQDENGNFDINSEIFKFNLQEMKFKSFQSVRTLGATDISYFNFEDSQSKEREHFLIFANSLGKNGRGSKSYSSLAESAAYKLVDNYFIPFQNFKLQGATQWLPVKGIRGEFLLLVSHANGVDGYQYDGWRFSRVSLHFGQSFFGTNVQSMRAFYYFGDLFLTIADKNSYGNRVNLWKLSFSCRNDLNRYYEELDRWCDEMQNNMHGDGFAQMEGKFSSVFDGASSPVEGSTPELKGESQSASDLEEKLRNELQQLNGKIKKIETFLKDTEELVEKRKTELEEPVVLGSQEIAALDLSCKTENCCRFKALQVLKVNGENLSDFLSSTVTLAGGLSTPILEFERVILESDLSCPLVNGRPADTLIDVSSSTLINADVAVNGTLFVNAGLRVSAPFGGDVPGAQHLLLDEDFQNITGTIAVDNLKIENLKLSGRLNGEPIESLLRKPNISLRTEYQELNVNNINVDGFLSGRNISEIFLKALKKEEILEVNSNFNVKFLEADEVLVEANVISNVSASKLFEAIEERICQNDPTEDFDNLLQFKSSVSNAADEYIVIVEGILKAKDFSDEDNASSLLNVVNSSFALTDSVTDLDFHFSDVVAEDLNVGLVNGIPLTSWVSKDLKHVQRIRGQKRFSEDVRVLEEVFVDRMNGVHLQSLERDVLSLRGNEVVRAEFRVNTVKCKRIIVNSTNFGKNAFDKMNRLELRNSILADRLEVENMTLRGDIDSVSWEKILDDFVQEKDFVSGTKTFRGALRAENLNVRGQINDLFFEEFVALTSADANKIVLDRNVTLKEPLSVEDLQFEGLLDSILDPSFDKEWLLQDEVQIITGPATFHNVLMRTGSSLMNETVNNVDLRKLFASSLKINEDTSLKHLYAPAPVRAPLLHLEGTLNGADLRRAALRAKARGPQTATGEWFFGQGLHVNGSLHLEGYLSGLNVSQMCALDPSDKVSLIVGGSLKLYKEPIVLFTVNEVDLIEKAKEVWMGDEWASVGGRELVLGDVRFDNRTTVAGMVSGVDLVDLSRHYLSRSRARVVSEDFVCEGLVVRKWCRMRRAAVGGPVNGLRVREWAGSVLLQDEEQEVRERLRFERFRTRDLRAEGTVNGANLAAEVLRLDVEDAVVEGEKTFGAINVLNLTLAQGRRLQNVDTDEWRESLVKTTGNVAIKGDLTLEDANFNKSLKVTGKVNDIHFDKQHLLTSRANQVVTAPKHLLSPVAMRYLEVYGRVGAVELGALLDQQALVDGRLLFGAPKTFARGLMAEALDARDLFQGVNVAALCRDVFRPVDVNARTAHFSRLIDNTKTLIKVAKDRAFFFHHFEVVQSLKLNIKAVVPTLHANGNYLLAMFTLNTMAFLHWNDHFGSFVKTEEELTLAENVTFVASEVFKSSSLLYIETEKSMKIFEPTLRKEIHATDTSCVASFTLNPLNKWCVFIGQKWNSSRILCDSVLMGGLQTYQWLESKGSVQVSALTIEDETFIAAINKEVVFDRIENTLSIYRFDSKLQHFYVSHTLAEINPVAVSSVSHKNDHYLVSAGGHLPESVHNSVLSIFRFDKRHKVFVRAQSIQVGTPVDVLFARLPSSQLALYVLSSNPTKPFVVFLHRGASGFAEETSGLSLYPGSHLYSFTDLANRHFVIISGFGRGQILRAGFKGQNAT